MNMNGEWHPNPCSFGGFHKPQYHTAFDMTEPQSPEAQQDLPEAGIVQQKATSPGFFGVEQASRYEFHQRCQHVNTSLLFSTALSKTLMYPKQG